MKSYYMETYQDRINIDLKSIRLLDLKVCQYVMEECLAEGNFNKLIIMINRVFSSPKNLMQSFKKPKEEAKSTLLKSYSYSGLDPMKLDGNFNPQVSRQSHYYDQFDVLDNDPVSSDNYNDSIRRSHSSTPYITQDLAKSGYLPSITTNVPKEDHQNLDLHLPIKGSHYISRTTPYTDPLCQTRPLSLDLEAARAGLDLFFSPASALEFNIPSVIHASLVEAVVGLSFNLDFELKFEKRSFELNPDFPNVFVLIFLIPRILKSADLERETNLKGLLPGEDAGLGGGEAYNAFVREALPRFCAVTSLLPLRMKSRLVRIWATMTPSDLLTMVHALQDCINHRIQMGEFGDRRYVNDDKTVVTAVKVLEILYYAAMVGGTLARPLSSVPVIGTDARNDSTESGGTANTNSNNTYTNSSSNIPTSSSLASRIMSSLNTSVENRLTGRRSSARSSGLDLINIVWRDFTAPIHIRSNRLETHLAFRAVDCLEPLILYTEFANAALNDVLIIERDYLDFRFPKSVDQFSFLNHPFVLTTTTKQKGLHLDNRIRMYDERRVVYLQNLLHGFSRSPPYLKFKVRRHRLIEDSLSNLELIVEDNPEDLKKQLIVEFEGETGHDHGGLSKEFFQLIVEQIFNQDFGMFTYNTSTGVFWFNPSSLENWAEFYLVGTIIGLAIYNAVILDVHFPPVLYSKLSGRPGRFADLAQTHPELHSGLTKLLQHSGNVEKDLDLNFRVILQDVYGCITEYELKPGGESISVTNDNREEFVDLYADLLLNQSVEDQFAAFFKGFSLVVDESPLHKFFLPHELELLICGSPHYDFHDFEQATTYEGGYTAQTPVVRYFWNTVHGMTDTEKSSLLKFATGSDRVPVGGLSNLKLVITRQGSDSDRLPTAHTCFNYLLIPEYESEDKLKERLLKAINHAKGFGLI